MKKYESVHEPQIETGCNCIYHRYNTVYICGCGKLVSHSQEDWNEHRLHLNGINIPSKYFYHEDSVITFFDRLHIWGLLPYFDENYKTVYNAISEMKEE